MEPLADRLSRNHNDGEPIISCEGGGEWAISDAFLAFTSRYAFSAASGDGTALDLEAEAWAAVLLVEKPFGGRFGEGNGRLEDK